MTDEASHAVNWAGCIPVCLTLAPTSVSSPTIPPPIHVLVPRHTFLHVGLQSAVQRLHPFAPLSLHFTGTSMLQISEPGPGPGVHGDSGGDDSDEGGQAKTKLESPTKATETSKHASSTFQYPVCWFEDEDTNLAVRWHLFAGLLYDLKTERGIPWKLRLHFTNYPSYSDMILPLEPPVLTHVHATYKHSLKQAMSIVSGNSRNAMNVTKESHGLLWEAIRLNNVAFFQRVDLLSKTQSPVAVPIRVLVNAVNPLIQRRVDGNMNLTLGELLALWLPDHFTASTATDEHGTPSVTCNDSVTCWRVSGIEPNLTTPVLHLWKQCSHPDLFLYVIVLTR